MESPLTPEQIAELEKPIDRKRVAHRQGGGGNQLSYIEGHEAIDAANRILGYGAWGFEIIGTPTRDHYTDGDGEIKAMWYTAKVRLHVRGCETIEEMGLVEVQIPQPGKEKNFGQQVDVAMKGAITDALKRALRCYGDQFGNSLYDKALVDGQVKQVAQQQRQQPTSQPTTPPTTQPAPAAPNRAAQAPTAPQQPRAVTPAAATPTPNPVPTGKVYEPATDIQKQAIQKMAKNKGWDEHDLKKRLFDLYGCPLESLPKSDAGHFIQVLQDKVV